MQYGQNPTLLDRHPTKGRTMAIAEFLHKKQGVQAPHQVPQPESPRSGRQAPEYLALKASGACVWEN